MREKIITRKLPSGRWEATLTVIDTKDEYVKIKSRTVRTDVSEQSAVDGVKRAAEREQALDRIW